VMVLGVDVLVADAGVNGVNGDASDDGQVVFVPRNLSASATPIS